MFGTGPWSQGSHVVSWVSLWCQVVHLRLSAAGPGSQGSHSPGESSAGIIGRTWLDLTVLVIQPGIAPPPEQIYKPTALKKRVGGWYHRTHKTVIFNNSVAVVAVTVLCAVYLGVGGSVVVMVVVVSPLPCRSHCHHTHRLPPLSPHRQGRLFKLAPLGGAH